MRTGAGLEKIHHIYHHGNRDGGSHYFYSFNRKLFIDILVYNDEYITLIENSIKSFTFQENDNENQESLPQPRNEREDSRAKSIPNYTYYMHSVYPEKYVEGQTWMGFVGIDDHFEHTMECAYLRLMAEDTIEVDPVEYIDEDTDPKRRKELGVTLKYLHEMDGYYLNNPDKKTLTWKIDENTEYIFLDWGRDVTQNYNRVEGE